MASLPPRVYADFHNADKKGRLRLICAGTADDLRQQKVSLKDGLVLRFYMEEVETTGTVRFSTDEDIWVAEIDWGAITSLFFRDHVPHRSRPGRRRIRARRAARLSSDEQGY